MAFREVVDAVRHRVRSGCGWRMPPIHLGHWRTVYGWFRELARRFLLQTLHDVGQCWTGRGRGARYLDFVVEIIRRSDQRTGFEAPPRRWVVGRSFAWMTRWRHLVGDSEERIDVSQAVILVAMGRNLLRQPTRSECQMDSEEEAAAVAFRRHTLLPLDDCLYALQPTIPHLTRSSLHRLLVRHGISRLPEVGGDKPGKQAFDQTCKAHGIGHRLTKPSHPWTNGQVERMNRTFKDATVKRRQYGSHDRSRPISRPSWTPTTSPSG